MSTLTKIIVPKSLSKTKDGVRITVPIKTAVNAVSIDSDYPDEAAMQAMRNLQLPKLTKLTKSLF
jgi:hypothetical protein